MKLMKNRIIIKLFRYFFLYILYNIKRLKWNYFNNNITIINLNYKFYNKIKKEFYNW
jgi:hypothetical protein